VILAAAVAPTPAAQQSGEAAAAVVRAYYDAVARKDYRSAYRLWSGGRSYTAFVRGYARTKWVKVEPIPPFVTEGGAGSVYCDVRVRVQAQLTDGTRQHFVGRYTLRRVNDVDGSTQAQRRWHIEQARVRPEAAGA
jgi:hypothetical protein